MPIVGAAAAVTVNLDCEDTKVAFSSFQMDEVCPFLYDIFIAQEKTAKEITVKVPLKSAAVSQALTMMEIYHVSKDFSLPQKNVDGLLNAVRYLANAHNGFCKTFFTKVVQAFSTNMLNPELPRDEMLEQIVSDAGNNMYLSLNEPEASELMTKIFMTCPREVLRGLFSHQVKNQQLADVLFRWMSGVQDCLRQIDYLYIDKSYLEENNHRLQKSVEIYRRTFSDLHQQLNSSLKEKADLENEKRMLLDSQDELKETLMDKTAKLDKLLKKFTRLKKDFWNLTGRYDQQVGKKRDYSHVDVDSSSDYDQHERSSNYSS